MTLPRAVLETRYCHSCNRKKGRTGFTDKIIKKEKRREREGKKRLENLELKIRSSLGRASEAGGSVNSVYGVQQQRDAFALNSSLGITSSGL